VKEVAIIAGLLELDLEHLMILNKSRGRFSARGKNPFQACRMTRASDFNPHTARYRNARTTGRFAIVRPCATMDTPDLEVIEFI
jgi:hypothetical protein